jgi:hypothetical protein
LLASDKLLSAKHFSVGGTLADAWAAVKKMRRRNDYDGASSRWGNPAVVVSFPPSERRSNEV